MRVSILSKPNCVWCDKLKELLQKNNIEYNEYDILTSEETKKMFLSCGFSTVPQIFVDGVHVGGFSDFVQKYYGEA